MSATEAPPVGTSDRVWRGSGIAFVVTFFISSVIYGSQPDIGASANALVSFYCQGPVSSPRGRTRFLPGDGHEFSPRADTGSPRGHGVRGITPLPAVAWARRMLSPVVAQRWAWWRSRSTVAPARVLGMISSKPLGWRLELKAMERFS
jgi:hypothetical protein